jgi:dynein heavy chain
MIKITFTAVLHLYCTLDPLINTDKKGKLKEEKPWNTALKMMNKPAAFLAQLNEFKGYVDTDKVPAQNFDAIRETLAMENFTPEVLNKASQAARGVCDWIINITKYYDVVVSVEPKKKAVREAEVQLEEAMGIKKHYEDLVADLKAQLKVLIDKLDAALARKKDAEETAAKCEKKLGLATRLVNALGAEGERWSASII